MDNVLVYYAAVEKGGLAVYAVCQILALHKQGVELHCVGPGFIREAVRNEAPGIQFTVLQGQSDVKPKGKVARALGKISLYRKYIRTLEKVVRENSYKRVLISSFIEYFAPFWVWPLRNLSREGVRFGVVVHDPIRDFVLGPKWWHYWSISLAYSFVDAAFVHDNTVLDIGKPKRSVTAVVIPIGPFAYPCPSPLPTKKKLREEFRIPEEATVLLSFGHVRDGKNLHLTIEALIGFPNCHLIVAGREQSRSQRPIEWYKELAEKKGVAARCHWFEQYISDEDVHRFFIVSDIVMLLYSSDFHSASGVMNVGINFRIPCIASSGVGPLRSVVEKYSLGLFVEPDDLEALNAALSSYCSENHDFLLYKWDQYLSDNSWQKNAQVIVKNFKFC